MKRWKLLVTLVALLCLALGSVPVVAQTPEPMTATQQSPVEKVVSQVEPAVVTVINEQTVAPPGGGEKQLQPVGSGSGFFIDDQGHIVTNNHVVAGGESFLVTFADQSVHSAELVGADHVSDLAVLKVSEQVPGTVALADSSQLDLGQSVVAIGSPLGEFTNTVTAGVVSGLNRSFPEGQPGSSEPADPVYTDLIQHTATINPGNSGGPLFDLTGQVVGINTLTIPTVPGENVPAQGLFFAIPANRVAMIVNRLIQDGSVTYPLLGIPNSVPIDAETAAVYNLPTDHGVLVTSVTPDSPAAQAGIQVDDIVTAIDGTQITFQTPYTDILFSYAPGDEVTITIQRGDQQMEVKATLAQRPAMEATPEA